MGDVHEAVRCQRNAIREARGHYAAPVVRLTRLLLESEPAARAVREYMTVDHRHPPARRVAARDRRRAAARGPRRARPRRARRGPRAAARRRRDPPDDGRRAHPARRPRRRPRPARRHRRRQRPATSSPAPSAVLVGLIADDADEVRAADRRAAARGATALYAAAYEPALAAADRPGRRRARAARRRRPRRGARRPDRAGRHPAGPGRAGARSTRWCRCSTRVADDARATWTAASGTCSTSTTSPTRPPTG